jgi:hypothetical protein
MPSPESEHYVLAAMNDPSGRRGIWYRCRTDGNRRTLELRGGREGDDVYVKIVEGLPIERDDLQRIADVLSRAAQQAQDDGASWELGLEPVVA